ncbi:MAG: 13E12 repeat family protein [Actinomycetota bacterium]|nr:13E12 repeat family protein [Actinomycetota bacterium]
MESVERVDAVVAALVEGLDGLDARGYGVRLQVAERLLRRVERAICGIVAGALRAGVWVEDGHRSVRGWLIATAHWSPAETTARLRTVTLLADLVSCGEALGAGSVGVAQVRELARARANPRCGDQLVEVEEILVGEAMVLPFEDFRRVVQRWEALADVEGAHRGHEAAHAGRVADADVVGEEFHFHAHGGTAQGAAIGEVFDKFVDAEFHADWELARMLHGDDVAMSMLARTVPQRRFDAFHAMAMAAAANRPGAAAPTPVVDIVVDQATFEAAVTALVTDRPLADTMPDVADPTTRRCETLDGTPLDPLDVVAAALIGDIRRVVFDSASCTIDLGRASRLFTGLSRLAVWLQGTRCLWPGCGRHHSQIDHSRDWTADGRTNPANAGPLCGWHNRWKTRGYHTWRDPDGHWHTHRPDGTEITAA